MNKKREFLTVKEVCELLKCSRNTFQSYVDTGELKVIKTKMKKYSKILVKRKDLDRFLVNKKLNLMSENKTKAKILTVKEVCELLKCSRNTFQSYVDTGALEVIKTKKKKYSKILVKRTEIYRFLEEKTALKGY